MVAGFIGTALQRDKQVDGHIFEDEVMDISNRGILNAAGLDPICEWATTYFKLPLPPAFIQRVHLLLTR